MNNKYLFNEKKAAQAAAYFLFHAGGRLPVLKLMKLLYLAERKSFELFGIPLIGDSLVSMDNGPVLSITLNKINGMSRDSAIWEEWIADRENHDLALRDASRVRSADDLLALSDSDLEALEEIWTGFGHWEKFRLCDYTHDNCPEWQDPEGSSTPISYDRLLTALGLKQESKIAIIEQLELQAQLNQAFAHSYQYQ